MLRRLEKETGMLGSRAWGRGMVSGSLGTEFQLGKMDESCRWRWRWSHKVNVLEATELHT